MKKRRRLANRVRRIDPPDPELPAELVSPELPILLRKEERDSAMDEATWRRLVMEHGHHRCGNCGSSDRLAVHFIVPLELGGQLVVSNGYVLCRACEMATAQKPSAPRRPINFWVSRKLSDRLDQLTGEGARFSSVSAFIRYLIALYVSSVDRFDDLSQFQDEGSDVKVNVWADRDTYEKFKALLDQRDLTVTNVLKALVLMFDEVGQSKEAHGH